MEQAETDREKAIIRVDEMKRNQVCLGGGSGGR